MAQDPLKVDQVQIEPGSAGVRVISSDPVSGAIRFQDSVVPSPTNLHSLAGLGTVANVLVVGKSGLGAQYSTIQSALDDIPAASSAANPHVVLVLSGIYTENLTLFRDGVFLVGVGSPVIRAAADDHTLKIFEQDGTVPLSGLVQGFRIENAYDGKAAVRVDGDPNSTLASSGISFVGCSLDASAGGGNFALYATTVNSLLLHGVTVSGNALSKVDFREVGTVDWTSGSCPIGLSLRYQTVNPEPSGGVVGGYTLSGLGHIGKASGLNPSCEIDLLGGIQTTAFHGCSHTFVRVRGSGTVEFYGGRANSLLVQGDSKVFLFAGAELGSVSAPNPVAVLRSALSGTESFAAAASVSVTFDIPQPDDNYQVAFELDARPANDEVPWVTGKVASGFTINFNTAQTLGVSWQVTRR